MAYTSNEIFNTIEQIAANGSKLEKQALVAEHGSDALFLKTLTLAYNPFVTFGIQAVPAKELFPSEAKNFDADTWKMFDALSSRQLTGNAARAAIKTEIDLLTTDSAELLIRVLKKDLRAGFSESTINKAIKGTIPEFPYQRCSLPKEVKFDEIDFTAHGGVISQVKADGMFGNVDHESGGIVRVTTRQGTPIPLENMQGFDEDVRKYLQVGTQTHGEFLVARDGKILPREVSNGIMRKIATGGSFADNEKPVFVAWDQIPLTSVVPKGECHTPYNSRFASLKLQLHDLTAGKEDAFLSTMLQIIPSRRVQSLADALLHYAEVLTAGGEGTVIKLPMGIWRDGTSKDQIKMKLEVEIDLEIVDFLPGSGKFAATFGSILCKSACGELEVAVSGIKDAVRKDMYLRREELKGMIMVVKANLLTVPSGKGKTKHSLFHPRYVEIRSDKTVADDLDRVRNLFASAISAVAINAMTSKAAEVQVEIDPTLRAAYAW